MSPRAVSKNDQMNSANRAEEVRRRRTERSQQRTSTAASRVVNPARSRPVTVRGSAFGTPIHRQAGTRPRRQLYLTMDQAAGTELRLPAIRMVNPGWRLLSGLIFILAAVGIYSMWSSPIFQIRAVDVTGLERLTPADINAVLKLDNLAVLEVDANQVVEELTTTFPELVDVRVSVEMPNYVALSAVERKPVIAFQSGDQTIWADADGIIFPARGDAGPLLTIIADGDLPLMPVFTKTEETSEDEEAAAGLETAGSEEPAAGTPQQIILRQVDPSLLIAVQGLSEKVPPEVQLVYSQESGLGWTDPGGWQVYIGRNLDEFEQKYAMYQSIAGSLANQGLQPAMVSVEYLNAPFYRLEQ